MISFSFSRLACRGKACRRGAIFLRVIPVAAAFWNGIRGACGQGWGSAGSGSCSPGGSCRGSAPWLTVPEGERVTGARKPAKTPRIGDKLGSKHPLLVEGQGIPLSTSLTGANRQDITQLRDLVEIIPQVRGKRGRPRQKPKRVHGERAYASEPPRRALKKRGARRSEPSAIRHMAADWAQPEGSSNVHSHGFISSESSE